MRFGRSGREHLVVGAGQVLEHQAFVVLLGDVADRADDRDAVARLCLSPRMVPPSPVSRLVMLPSG